VDQELKRILYVEDEADIRKIVILSIGYLGGFQFRPCASGQEAIDVAPGFRPDLILLDAMMPDMDGIQTLKRLRELPETERTPIVFLTAYVGPTQVEAYKQLGAIEVIAKPFDPVKLPLMLCDIWARFCSGRSRSRHIPATT
jgi:two-component system, OmpR family, response regulator